MESGVQHSDVLFCRERSKAFLRNAKKEAKKDIKKKVEILIKNPDVGPLLKTFKALTSTTSWLGHSYYRYYKSQIEKDEKDLAPFLTLEENDIIKKIISKDKKIVEALGHEKVFSAVYKEALLSHSYSNFSSKFLLPRLQTVIVVLDGVFNELFSQSFFERSLKKLSQDMGTQFLIPKISGIKGSAINNEIIKKELHEYSLKYPSKKFWLLGYSKGGIDALHFISKNKSFAEDKVKGLSTLATPLLGSDKFSRGALKYLQSFQKKIDKDLFLTELQNSLNSKYQKLWFLNNYRTLPKSMFYSSLGFEAKWKESHLWMLLTKLIFQSQKSNDGVVDTYDAHFPWFFPSIKLGTIPGHHLIGLRSTFQSQEAILEAHLIYLSFLGMID
tara:strand:+ start:35 stop:1192 length:1158 start_codon:yes stop_codon:yes gene_type:complete